MLNNLNIKIMSYMMNIKMTIVFLIVIFLVGSGVKDETKKLTNDEIFSCFTDVALLHDRGLSLLGFHKSTSQWIAINFILRENKYISLTNDDMNLLVDNCKELKKKNGTIYFEENAKLQKPGQDDTFVVYLYSRLNDEEKKNIRALILHREGLLSLNRSIFHKEYNITQDQLLKINSLSKEFLQKKALPLHRDIFNFSGVTLFASMLELRTISKSCDSKLYDILDADQKNILLKDVLRSMDITKEVGFNESYVKGGESDSKNKDN